MGPNETEGVSNAPSNKDFSRLKELGLDLPVNEKEYQITPEFMEQQQLKVVKETHKQATNPGATNVFRTSDAYKQVLHKQNDISQVEPQKRIHMHQNPSPSAPALEAHVGGGNGNNIPPTEPPIGSPANGSFEGDGGFGGEGNFQNIGGPSSEYDPIQQMIYGDAGLPPKDTSAQINGLGNKTTAVILTELLWEEGGPLAIAYFCRIKSNVMAEKGIPLGTRQKIQREIDAGNNRIRNNSEFPKKEVAEWRDAATMVLNELGWNHQFSPMAQLIVATAKLGAYGYGIVEANLKEMHMMEEKISETIAELRGELMSMRDQLKAELLAELQAEAKGAELKVAK